MSYEQSPMSKILETIADRLVDMHMSNNRRFDELAAQLEALLPAKVGEQLSLLAIVTASEPTVVPNEDEAMPVVEPMIVQDEPSPRKRKAPTYWSKTDSQAAAFTAAATAARNSIPPLAYRLANDTLTPSERAGLLSRVEVLEAKHKAAKSDYQKRVKLLGYVHPPTKPKGDK